MPEVEISRHDVISDVRRVLALTKSPEMPEGDLRISTYLEVGRYSRSTIYKHFRGWQELLASIFGTPKTERYVHVTVPKRHLPGLRSGLYVLGGGESAL
jgi:hypothetical protein